MTGPFVGAGAGPGAGVGFDVVEASVARLREALQTGEVTSVELVAAYLLRIAAYDRTGPRLSSVPVLSPSVFADARASDERRRCGEVLGPLDGIPYTVKDSYLTRGLPAAAGSPAFAGLLAHRDAFTVERLRAGGAVLLGRTTMPPMANGGMQRGLHGRAESPYNADFLTAAFASGSSNGSGTSTAASFAAFGLAEETWSSGRAPASNNGLVAYTPSRGVISVRGNWPLTPTMDVVVPHTRTVADLLELLEVVVHDDAETRGDLWRSQPWVEVPRASEVRPERYASLVEGLAQPRPLAGRRLGVPRMYVGDDTESLQPILTRGTVLDLWSAARADLERLGAELVEVDLPVVTGHDRGAMVARGLVPPGFADLEMWDLSIWAWDDFLRANADPSVPDLASVDGPLIFPHPTGALPDRYGDADYDLADYVTRARRGVIPPDRMAGLREGLLGLEETRRLDLEVWLDGLGLDALVFPAVADIGPSDADTDPDSADLAWRNGTWVANGNLVWRHLGIPTVTVPMGVLADIAMPVGLTFAGRAYADSDLIRLAAAFEASGDRRVAPPRTPVLPPAPRVVPLHPAGPALDLAVSLTGVDDEVVATIRVSLPGGCTWVQLWCDGVPVELDPVDLVARVVVTHSVSVRHSEWLEPYGCLVVAVCSVAGPIVGAYAEAALPSAGRAGRALGEPIVETS